MKSEKLHEIEISSYFKCCIAILKTKEETANNLLADKRVCFLQLKHFQWALIVQMCVVLYIFDLHHHEKVCIIYNFINI